MELSKNLFKTKEGRTNAQKEKGKNKANKIEGLNPNTSAVRTNVNGLTLQVKKRQFFLNDKVI